MELGAKLADGSGTAIHAWGTDRVVKLFPAGSERIADLEARNTQIAFDTGAPAPQVFGTVDVDGRRGIVFPRYDGQTLQAQALAGAISAEETGAIIARLHHGLHTGAYVTPIYGFRVWFAYSLSRLQRRGIDANALAKVERVAADLPDGGVLCHGDFHLGNVMMTSGGPRIIDWVTALSAAPLFDVARLHLTLRLFGPDIAELRALRDTADAAFLSTYAALDRTTVHNLRAALAPYETVLAATRLLENGGPEEAQALVTFVNSSEPLD